MSLGLEFEDIHAYKQARKEGGMMLPVLASGVPSSVPILHLPLPGGVTSGKLLGFPQPPFSSL